MPFNKLQDSVPVCVSPDSEGFVHKVVSSEELCLAQRHAWKRLQSFQRAVENQVHHKLFMAPDAWGGEDEQGNSEHFGDDYDISRPRSVPTHHMSHADLTRISSRFALPNSCADVISSSPYVSVTGGTDGFRIVPRDVNRLMRRQCLASELPLEVEHREAGSGMIAPVLASPGRIVGGGLESPHGVSGDAAPGRRLGGGSGPTSGSGLSTSTGQRQMRGSRENSGSSDGFPSGSVGGASAGGSRKLPGRLMRSSPPRMPTGIDHETNLNPGYAEVGTPLGWATGTAIAPGARRKSPPQLPSTTSQGSDEISGGLHKGSAEPDGRNEAPMYPPTLQQNRDRLLSPSQQLHAQGDSPDLPMQEVHQQPLQAYARHQVAGIRPRARDSLSQQLLRQQQEHEQRRLQLQHQQHEEKEDQLRQHNDDTRLGSPGSNKVSLEGAADVATLLEADGFGKKDESPEIRLDAVHGRGEHLVYGDCEHQGQSHCRVSTHQQVSIPEECQRGQGQELEHILEQKQEEGHGQEQQMPRHQRAEDLGRFQREVNPLHSTHSAQQEQQEWQEAKQQLLQQQLLQRQLALKTAHQVYQQQQLHRQQVQHNLLAEEDEEQSEQNFHLPDSYSGERTPYGVQTPSSPVQLRQLSDMVRQQQQGRLDGRQAADALRQKGQQEWQAQQVVQRLHERQQQDRWLRDAQAQSMEALGHHHTQTSLDEFGGRRVKHIYPEYEVDQEEQEREEEDGEEANEQEEQIEEAAEQRLKHQDRQHLEVEWGARSQRLSAFETAGHKGGATRHEMQGGHLRSRNPMQLQQQLDNEDLRHRKRRLILLEQQRQHEQEVQLPSAVQRQHWLNPQSQQLGDVRSQQRHSFRRDREWSFGSVPHRLPSGELPNLQDESVFPSHSRERLGNEGMPLRTLGQERISRGGLMQGDVSQEQAISEREYHSRMLQMTNLPGRISYESTPSPQERTLREFQGRAVGNQYHGSEHHIGGETQFSHPIQPVQSQDKAKKAAQDAAIRAWAQESLPGHQEPLSGPKQPGTRDRVLVQTPLVIPRHTEGNDGQQSDSASADEPAAWGAEQDSEYQNATVAETAELGASWQAAAIEFADYGGRSSQSKRQSLQDGHFQRGGHIARRGNEAVEVQGGGLASSEAALGDNISKEFTAGVDFPPARTFRDGPSHPASMGSPDGITARMDSSSVHDKKVCTLRQWLCRPGRVVDRLETLYIVRQIVGMVNVAHSQGKPLHHLVPSRLVLSPSIHVELLETQMIMPQLMDAPPTSRSPSIPTPSEVRPFRRSLEVPKTRSGAVDGGQFWERLAHHPTAFAVAHEHQTPISSGLGSAQGWESRSELVHQGPLGSNNISQSQSEHASAQRASLPPGRKFSEAPFTAPPVGPGEAALPVGRGWVCQWNVKDTSGSDFSDALHGINTKAGSRSTRTVLSSGPPNLLAAPPPGPVRHLRGGAPSTKWNRQQQGLRADPGDHLATEKDTGQTPLFLTMRSCQEVMDGNMTKQGPDEHLKEVEAAEALWYESPEELDGQPASLESDIYRLGVLIFELFCTFVSMTDRVRAMSDLRHRILPPRLLSERPKEAAFCLWLLHPEPSVRPKIGDVLASDLLSEAGKVHKERQSEVGVVEEDEESELLLEFLQHMEALKMESAQHLTTDLARLDFDIQEVEGRRARLLERAQAVSLQQRTLLLSPQLEAGQLGEDKEAAVEIERQGQGQGQGEREGRQLEMAEGEVQREGSPHGCRGAGKRPRPDDDEEDEDDDEMQRRERQKRACKAQKQQGQWVRERNNSAVGQQRQQRSESKEAAAVTGGGQKVELKSKSARVMRNFAQLEKVYFSMRWKVGPPAGTKVLGITPSTGGSRADVAEQPLLLQGSTAQNAPTSLIDGTSAIVKTRNADPLGAGLPTPSHCLLSRSAPEGRPGHAVKIPPEEAGHDWLGAFFDSLCKFARYSRFEVRATLRHGDLLNTANMVCSLSFDRDEEFFATAGVCRRIKIFECDSVVGGSSDNIHYPVVEMATRTKISSVCWNSYIKNQIASSDYEGVVQLWDASTSQPIMEFEEHEKRAWSVDFSRADPTRLASGSDDGSVKLWSISQESSVATINTEANVCCVQFPTESPHMLAFGSADYKVYCHDLRNPREPLCVLGGHTKAVSYVKFLDANTLVSASTDNTLKLWDLTKVSAGDNARGGSLSPAPECALTYSGHTNEKNFVGLTVADGYIACGSETNEVFAYHKSLPMPMASHKFGGADPITGAETEDDAGQFVSSVCWRGKSQTLVAANSMGNIKVLEMV